MFTDTEMIYGLTVTQEPGVEPITLDESVDQLREEIDTVQGDYVESLIIVARQWAESFLRRPLITTTYRLTLDDFGGQEATIYLPRPKVQSVTEIRYIDTAGDQQTLDNSLYRQDLVSLTARIDPAYGECWPSTREVSNAVEVDFTAGYGDSAEDVPEPIKQALKMIVSHYYENRSPVVVGTIVAEIPMTIKSLLTPYRVEGSYGY